MRDIDLMDVEKRDVDETHGVRPPTMPIDFGYDQQLFDTLELVECAKQYDDWDRVAKVLNRYCPHGRDHSGDVYKRVMEDFGFHGWTEVVQFVRDDECWEVFGLVLAWAKKNGLKLDVEGFIEGSGMGVMDLYSSNVKAALQKCFDVKWTYYKTHETRRPLQRFRDSFGSVCRNFYVYLHPRHPRYIAGHSAKVAAAVETILQLIPDFPEALKFDLYLFMFTWSMARTGGGVHLPEDNLGGGFLVGIEGYEIMGDTQAWIGFLNEYEK